MSWVMVTASWATAESVSATGPPSPMFSPADVQCTPASVSRAPSEGSPGHWWDSPQPLAIIELCAAELRPRPVLSVYAGSPAWAPPCWSPGGLAAGGDGLGGAVCAGGGGGDGDRWPERLARCRPAGMAAARLAPSQPGGPALLVNGCAAHGDAGAPGSEPGVARWAVGHCDAHPPVASCG